MNVSPGTTLASTAATATEKEAFRSRQGELHRLFNNRKGCFGATNKRNVEANDRAYDMNQKTKQALYTLAEECSTSEATMKKVTVADELERSQKGRGPSAGRTGLLL